MFVWLPELSKLWTNYHDHDIMDKAELLVIVKTQSTYRVSYKNVSFKSAILVIT